MPTPLLSYSFRPFFILAGAYAAIAVLGWVAYLFGGLALPLSWSPMHWHSHEMLYGWTSAAIAGFLLTAITNWTGAKPLSGGPLLALVLLWLAGRVAFWATSLIPPLWVAVVDLSFLAVLGLYVAAVLVRHKNHRNLILVAVILLLFTGNLWMHLGFMTGTTAYLQQGERLGFNLISLLLAIIAGRITPAFTVNWLKRTGGNSAAVVRYAGLDKVALIALALLIPLDIWFTEAPWLGWFLLVTAALHAARLLLWKGWLALKEPLLWILHLGYLWLVLSLLARGLNLIEPVFSNSLWVHTLGMGAIGTLILGVMTRVCAGHTGRPLKLVPYAWISYAFIVIATVLRLLAASGMIDYRWGVNLSALFWILSFGLFTVLYTPILLAPRADGKPG
ncbi:MAG: NnrS family protein [Saccharospirillum sp.]|nr:NnrS family protein [Saccharospirillum sp.]